MPPMPTLPSVKELYPPKITDDLSQLMSSIVATRSVGGYPQELRRMLTVDERAGLMSRAQLLNKWLTRMPRNEIASTVTHMLMMLSKKNLEVKVAMEIATGWAAVLGDLPKFAIVRACLQFEQGRVTPADLGVEKFDIGWEPNTAQVHRVARQIMADTEAEHGLIQAILRTPILLPPPAKVDPARVDQAVGSVARYLAGRRAAKDLDVQKTQMGRDARRQQDEAESQRRMIESYTRRGLDAPMVRPGEILISCDFKLEHGWTIEEGPGGKMTLISSPRAKAEA